MLGSDAIATLVVAAVGMTVSWAVWVTVMIFEVKAKIALIKQEIDVLKEVRDVLNDIRIQLNKKKVHHD